MTQPQENEIAYIGHNGAPIEYNPATYDNHVIAVNKLYDDAHAMFTGVCVETQEQYDTVEDLKKSLGKLRREVDADRLGDKAPYKDMGDFIQGNYAALIKKLTDAESAYKTCVQPFLTKKEEERQQAAKAAREEEERKAKALEDAQKTKDSGDMESIEALNEAADELKAAEKASAKTRKPTATGMKTVYTPTITDKVEVIKHYWTEPKIAELLLALINADIRAGKREIPGVSIKEERVAR
jgi:hypothetical protein